MKFTCNIFLKEKKPQLHCLLSLV